MEGPASRERSGSKACCAINRPWKPASGRSRCSRSWRARNPGNAPLKAPASSASATASAAVPTSSASAAASAAPVEAPEPPPIPAPDPPIALATGGKAAVHATSGVVTSVEANATRAGVKVLESGGNAIDAAVAVGYALAVTHPSAGNIGGGGFMIVRLASGESYANRFS